MDELSSVRSSLRAASRRATVRGACLAVAIAGAASFALAAPSGAAAACTSPPTGSLLFHGTQSEGTVNINGRAKAEGVGGTISCGVLELATGHFKIPAEDIVYNPFTLKLLGFLPLESTLTVDAAAEGALGPHFNEAGEENGYETAFTAPVTGTVNFLGIAKCAVGPFSPTLTTGKSGKLEGHFLEGEILTGLSGQLVANEFAVPAIAGSKECPGFLAFLSNLIIGLPAKAGASSVTTTATLAPGE
jgi:hypothetical protein